METASRFASSSITTAPTARMKAFETVTPDSHPAVPKVLSYLESISHKNMRAFAESFGPHRQAPFFANLPGGVRVQTIQKFIDMHQGFFESDTSRFEYGSLTQGIGGDDFFMGSVTAKVILPNGSQREVAIDMTFFKVNDFWIPSRFINTVLDASQIVIH